VSFDRLCLQKLRPVSFGSYNSADRILRGIEHALDHGRAISEAQRLTMYKLCWHYRGQIADWPFQARVLIVRAHLEEMLEVDWPDADRPRVRAWRAGAAKVDRRAVEDLFAGHSQTS
jgi:hypothetical protein